QSDHHMLLQKQVLKIFYALIQFQFPTEVLPRPILTQWLKALRPNLSKPAVVPGGPLPPDEEDRLEMPGWKLYKWALDILNRVFECYGCPSTVAPEHKTFASWYLKTFSEGILQVSVAHHVAAGQCCAPCCCRSVLRTMLLQVIVAHHVAAVAEHFVKQWIEDVDCFLGLHDRKLCVLGLCTLLQLGPTRVPALSQCYSKILPALLVLFQGLKRAYAAKAAEENNDDDDDDDDEDPSDLENEVLDSDEDELNENDSYLENLKDHIDNNGAEFGISTSIQVRLHCPRRNSTVHI
ncbi:Armadillo-type fold, partial [Trinorchestia longiramus]